METFNYSLPLAEDFSQQHNLLKVFFYLYYMDITYVVVRYVACYRRVIHVRRSTRL